MRRVDARSRRRALVGCDPALHAAVPRRIEQSAALVMHYALRSAQAYVLRAFVLHADDNQATIA
ncbi:hypothetical protein EX530_14090 [Xanthomonas phaseoli]